MGVNGEALQLHAVYSKVRMIKPYHHRNNLYWKKYHSFVAVCIVTCCTHNNTDGNKLVIFYGIALYYGDTYMLMLYTIP